MFLFYGNNLGYFPMHNKAVFFVSSSVMIPYFFRRSDRPHGQILQGPNSTPRFRSLPILTCFGRIHSPVPTPIFSGWRWDRQNRAGSWIEFVADDVIKCSPLADDARTGSTTNTLTRRAVPSPSLTHTGFAPCKSRTGIYKSSTVFCRPIFSSL